MFQDLASKIIIHFQADNDDAAIGVLINAFSFMNYAQIHQFIKQLDYDTFGPMNIGQYLAHIELSVKEKREELESAGYQFRSSDASGLNVRWLDTSTGESSDVLYSIEDAVIAAAKHFDEENASVKSLVAHHHF